MNDEVTGARVAIRIFRGYLAAEFLAVAAFFFVPRTSLPHGLWQVAVGWSAAASVLVGWRRLRPGGATTWVLFAVGLFLNSAGILVAEVLARVYKITAPPTLADPFYLGIFPATGLGLGLLIRRRTAGRSGSTLVDTTIITTGLALLSWVLVIRPQAEDAHLRVFARMVVCAYPIGDLVILAMIIRLLLSGGSRTTSLRLTIGAMVCFLGTDIGWAAVLQSGVNPGRVLQWALESGSLMAFTLIGAAALHPSVVSLAQKSPPRPIALSRTLLAGLTAASLIAPAVLLVQALHQRVTDGVAIAVSSTLLFVLVVMRMSGLLKRLEEQSHQLEADITARKEVERRLLDSLEQLRRTQQQLVRASHMAGMAEIATSVLHNVGNVLNSVNIAAGAASDILMSWSTEDLEKIVKILRAHAVEGGRLTDSPRAMQVLAYLEQRTQVEQENKTRMHFELETLQKNIDHIRMIVTVQQDEARVNDGLTENLDPADVIEDALRMTGTWDGPDGVRVVRDYQPMTRPEIERHRVLQILTNLLANARQAIANAPEKVVTVRIEPRGAQRFAVEVRDTGCGIAEENLTKIFNHGFTTRKDGHGFGLHSSALAASAMGGALVVQSDGPGHGARFVLELPVRPAPRS